MKEGRGESHVTLEATRRKPPVFDTKNNPNCQSTAKRVEPGHSGVQIMLTSGVSSDRAQAKIFLLHQNRQCCLTDVFPFLRASFLAALPLEGLEVPPPPGSLPSQDLHGGRPVGSPGRWSPAGGERPREVLGGFGGGSVFGTERAHCIPTGVCGEVKKDRKFLDIQTLKATGWTVTVTTTSLVRFSGQSHVLIR
ncbi:hypothetical protein SRHO_G00257840 [Serrasalmus rhombeus]